MESILLNGFWPRYCVEDVEWARTEDADAGRVAIPMVCFCDIPLSRIDEHVLFYGEFGVGLSREWAIRSGLSPIQYAVEGSRIAKIIAHLSEFDGVSPEKKHEYLLRLLPIATNIKPLSGAMVVAGKPIVKDFYSESEWRFVASDAEVEPFLMQEEFEDPGMLSHHNDTTRTHSMLRFLPSDVKYIFVRSDTDIPSVINFIQSELDHHPAADLKVLMSRVTSLDTVRSDW